MLKVNLNNGRTLRYDLANSKEAAEWAALAKNYSFQAQITGLSLSLNGVSYALPKPRDFKDIFLFAEAVSFDESGRMKGGEQIICNAGEIQVVLTAHSGQRALRVDVARPGKMQYNSHLYGSSRS